ITDRELEMIVSLQKLRYLFLVETSITEGGLRCLASLPSLRTLSIESNVLPMGDDAAIHIAAISSLEELALVGTNLTDKGLGHLQQIPSLSHFEYEPKEFNGPICSYEGMEEFKAAMPNCRVVVIMYFSESLPKREKHSDR